jgi:tryptophanyl-tRNA synthetase
MAIKTDSTPVMEPKDPDNCILFAIYSLFLDKDGIAQLRDRYLTPGLKYNEVKKELVDIIWDYFAPYREKWEKLAKSPDDIKSILKQGAEKARQVGGEFLAKARKNVGLIY